MSCGSRCVTCRFVFTAAVATGKDDFLLGTTKATVAMLEKHGFSPVYRETDGGHTWVNWRHYLTEFTPMLFKPAPASSASK